MLLKNEAINKSAYKKNLTKIILETILSSIGAGFSVATITIFWNSIGMDQTAIGFVQMIFTIVIVCLDIPMAYIADRFNRKILNIVGDIGVSIVFVFYAFSQNVYMALISECLLGVFMAMTNGVDQSFIKFNCDKIDESGQLFRKTNVRVYIAKYIALLIVVVLGGFIAKFNLRLTIALSFIPYFLGGLIAFFIVDYNEKAEVKHSNPFKDMICQVKDLIKKKSTRIYLISYILGKEITHSQIWVFTPLLIMVGVPIEVVSAGWVLNQILQIFGAKLSEKMLNLKNYNNFFITVFIEFSWMLILILNTNIVTVWLFAFNGFVHGLIEGNLMISLQESVKNELQTSVVSIASTGARLLYIPLVFIVNFLGNLQLQLALVGVCSLFFPMCFFTYIKLRSLENG